MLFKMRKRVEKVKHVAVKSLDMQLSILAIIRG